MYRTGYEILDGMGEKGQLSTLAVLLGNAVYAQGRHDEAVDLTKVSSDEADPLQAEGIPCAFAEYLVERNGHWERVERGIPRRFERIQSVP